MRRGIITKRLARRYKRDSWKKQNQLKISTNQSLEVKKTWKIHKDKWEMKRTEAWLPQHF